MQCTALYQPSVLNSFCHLSSLLQHTFSLSISICGQFPQVHGKETGTTGTGSSGSKSSLSDFPLGCGAGSSLNKKNIVVIPEGPNSGSCGVLWPSSKTFSTLQVKQDRRSKPWPTWFFHFSYMFYFSYFSNFSYFSYYFGLVWPGLASILLYLSCKHVCSCLSLRGTSVSHCDRVVWWPWLCL